jgi:K+-transporting ATPase ATPase C chain
MRSQLRPALLAVATFTVLTGIAYPLAMTGLAQVVFPYRANGSLLEVDGRTVGSELIGQPFTSPAYFWSRPSATSPVPYNAASSSGSNLATTSAVLRDAVAARVAALREADPGNGRPIPIDLVTASGSGLDPHISPAAAAYQVERVAKMRGLPVERVRALVAAHTRGRQLGVLGEPTVNVLRLNLALDALAPGAGGAAR